MAKEKTVLVVDDVADIRNILHFNLEKLGYKVLEANNGMKALSYANSDEQPDLIILDIMMPKMDGYETLRKLKESTATRHIPVIFLTSKAHKKDVLKGIDVGADDYVVKPFKFADVHKKIRRLLENRPVRELAAVMITDIVGYSSDMEDNEESTYSKLLTHNQIIRKIISRHKGDEIKTIGDAFLIRFKSAVDAVKASLDAQEEFTKFNEEKTESDQIQVRIGVHIGDIMIREHDVFGNGINVVSRIVPLAPPNGIVITADAHNAVKASMNLDVVNLGKQELKNIKHPPELFLILPQGPALEPLISPTLEHPS